MLMRRLFPIFILLICAISNAQSKYFAIQVLDDQTNRAVPLVQLETTNARKYFTDSGGFVAFYEPGMMDRKTFVTITSHGYEYPKDGFGIHGTDNPGSIGHAKSHGCIRLRNQDVERLFERVRPGDVVELYDEDAEDIAWMFEER